MTIFFFRLQTVDGSGLAERGLHLYVHANRTAQEFAMLINLAKTSSLRMQKKKIHPHIFTPLNVLAIQDKEGFS